MRKVNFAKQVAFVCQTITINMTAFCLSLHANHRAANKHFHNWHQRSRLFIARFAFPRSLFLLPTHPQKHFSSFPAFGYTPIQPNRSHTGICTHAHYRHYHIKFWPCVKLCIFYRRRSYYYPSKQKVDDTFCQGSCHPSLFNFCHSR